MDEKLIVMVVDDEAGIRTLVSIMLEQAGFVVLKAENALQALAMLRETKPNLLIADVMMPQMDGTELCRQIRRCPDCRWIPILLLSARSDPESVRRGLEAGADAYLTKPVFSRDLVRAARSLLECAKGRNNSGCGTGC